MAGILFVHAGDDFARATYERDGRAYWSRSFPVVLEKHGYVDLDVAEPKALEDPNFVDRYDVILVARLPEEAWTPEALARIGSSTHARTIIEGRLPSAFEQLIGVVTEGTLPADGLFRPVSEAVSRVALERFGTAATARIGGTTSKPSPWPAELSWRNLDVPISARQADAWGRPTWDPVRWSTEEDSQVLGIWERAPGEASPAVVRKGPIIGWSFGVFAYLAQTHTSAPYDEGEFRTSQSPYGLEAFLLALIDSLIAEAQSHRLRVLPWPLGARWALTVRHDFDRNLSAERVDGVLAEHDRVGTSATWYWRASQLTHSSGLVRGLRSLGNPRRYRGNGSPIQRVSSHPRHEVALHTEHLWKSGDVELRRLERAAGSRVRGTSAHGSADCFRYQGAPNVLWAAMHGLDYTENLQHFHLHPHRFVALAADGLTDPLDIFCLPKHQSFDRSTARRDVYASQVAEVVPRYQSAAGLLQVMNHPDIHTAELFELLDDLPRDGRIDWTAERLIRWWRSSHDLSRVRIRSTGDGAFTASTTGEVRNAVAEILAPNGSVARRVFSAGADSSALPRDPLARV